MPALRSLCFVPALVLATLMRGSAAILAGVMDRRSSWTLCIVPFWSRLLLRAGAGR